MTTESIIGLVALAFALSWDNFRSSVALGTVPFGAASRRADRPGLRVLGRRGAPGRRAPRRYFGEAVGPVAEYVGPAVLGAYGLYLLVGAVRNPEPDEVDHPWVTLFGLPLALSVDNLIAGTGLGLLGFSPVVPAIGFGIITAVMSATPRSWK